MYRIMIAQSKKANYGSLYQYLTTTVDGAISPLEIATKEDLDKKIESMLNDDGYAKSDFIVVEVVDYTIDATDYSDDEADNATSDDTATDSTEEGTTT